MALRHENVASLPCYNNKHSTDQIAVSAHNFGNRARRDGTHLFTPTFTTDFHSKVVNVEVETYMLMHFKVESESGFLTDTAMGRHRLKPARVPALSQLPKAPYR